MIRNRVLSGMLSLIVVLCTFVYAGIDKTSDKQQLVHSLQGMVDNLLKGNNLSTITPAIDVEAYVVDGTYFESLPAVVKGESIHCHLVEGKDSRSAFQSLIVNDEQNAAFMIVKTQSPNLGERFHSVVFFKGASHDWKIKSWHISH